MQAKILSNLVLHSYWRSSCSWRVRIVLNIKKIEHTIKTVNLLKDEHKTEEYALMNPIKRVPVLEFQEKSEKYFLPESTAICEFLEEAYPEINVLPHDIILKAKVRVICNEISGNIQPFQNLNTLNKVAEFGGDKTEWAKEFIGKGLDVLEKLIISSRGKYCVGDQVTLADIYLIPQLYGARRFNIDINNYPNIREIELNLNIIDAFINACADNQIDAVLV